MVVVVAVILISVGLYVSIDILEPQGYIPEPSVQFSAAEASGPNEWRVQVAGVNVSRDHYNYQAVLLRNGVRQGEVMNPLQEATVGNITFTDLTGDGELTVGDFFTITTWSGGSYELSIIWIDSGGRIGRAEWGT